MSEKRRSRAARRNSSIWSNSEDELENVLEEANSFSNGYPRDSDDDDDQYDDDDDDIWNSSDDDDDRDYDEYDEYDDDDSDDVDVIDWENDFKVDDDEVELDSLYPSADTDHQSGAPLWSAGIPQML